MIKVLIISIFLIITMGCITDNKHSGVPQNTYCTVTNTNNGSEITCPDGSTAFISNGNDGRDGQNGLQGVQGAPGNDGNDGRDGQDGIDGKDAIIKIIDPCGPSTSGYDEILLCLNNGSLMAYFENGIYRHLSIIPAGAYVTTDEQKCRFDVLTNGNIKYLDGSIENCNN